MQPQLSSRINLAELKAQIVKRIGTDKSKRYFYYLNRFLSQKLSKTEFNRSCYRVLGRENIPLHNHFITVTNFQTPNASIWSNGVLPVSPRKLRSGVHRKLKDRPSPLGPNGKLPENGMGDVIQIPAQKPRIHGKGPTAVSIVEDGEEVEQLNRLNFSRSPLIAPLGIPYCTASVGGARKALPVNSTGDFISCCDNGRLSDTDTLRKRMEQIATVQGLGSVSMECANTLNNVLDVYLKRLIRSCIDLVGARSPVSVSLRDFKVAMELNPQQLGEDWPLQLEKISMQSFEE
uniref:Uncharacterized protein n=1 Tax=Cajanus cajan TaxID=3821 RepID=A0A151R5Y8_CAJCA|nr:hypothetical protein KK1_040881 [Cajanus cajan]KYP37900.1 hypothetical protein KK1_040882 [Cajanus cajan]